VSGRNVELTREAGRLRRLGKSPEEIEAELLNHPGRNGLPPAEVRAIARSIGAKPPGPKIERPADGWPSATHEFACRRGWPVSAIETLGAIAKKHEVHFPMRMASGEVVGWRRRRADNRPFRGDTKALAIKDSKAMLIMPEALPSDTPLAMTESETGAAAIIAAGHRAVLATPGGKPSSGCIAQAQKVAAGRTVVLFPDPDEVGDAWRRRLGGALLRVDCRVLFAPPIDCDIDERLRRDPDPRRALARLISGSIPLTERAHHDPLPRNQVVILDEAPEEAQGPAATIAEVLEVFKKWLYLPDPGSVYVPLAAVAANRMEGDPVWQMVVGPSSGGKTESIIATASLPYVRLGATLTQAALLSGTPKKQSVGKGGLLREIGNFGILALKDFTSVLSMQRDQRAQLLAALREIFDGSWTRHVGADGGKTLEWTGKLGLIAGCTAAIDSHHSVMSVMGERFLLYRLPTIDPAKQAERALANAGRVRVMRKELAAVVRRLFAGLDISKELPSIDERETKRLVALSSLVASARSAVERDSYRREIELIHDTEAPARLAQTLRLQFAGMLAIGLDRATAWPLVAKSGLDCIPKLRRSVFDTLLAARDWLTTTAIATATQHPTTTTRRSLEDLCAHGVVERQAGGKGKHDRWVLAALARDRYAAVGAPEMSKGEKRASSSSFSYTLHKDDDKLGNPSQTAAECGFEGGDTGATESEERHCWACKADIDDDEAERCPTCEWFICSCGACGPECSGREAAGPVEVEV